MNIAKEEISEVASDLEKFMEGLATNFDINQINIEKASKLEELDALKDKYDSNENL